MDDSTNNHAMQTSFHTLIEMCECEAICRDGMEKRHLNERRTYETITKRFGLVCDLFRGIFAISHI